MSLVRALHPAISRGVSEGRRGLDEGRWGAGGKKVGPRVPHGKGRLGWKAASGGRDADVVNLT